MWGSRFRPTFAHHALLALAMFACVLRGFVPQGYMVQSGARPGEVVIAFCSEHGNGQAAFDLETGAVRPLGDADDDEPNESTSPCVFAQAAVAAPPLTAAAVSAPIGAIVAAHDGRVASVAIGRGLAAPPPPARGPPILL